MPAQMNLTLLRMTIVKNKIRKFIIQRVDTLTCDITHPHTIRLLRKLVYTWFLINTIILIPSASEFWGDNSFIPTIDSEIAGKYKLLYLLSFNSFAPYYAAFIGLQIILLILGILCIYPRLVSLLIYLVTINLDNKAYVILDGGNNIMQLILIYMIFMDPSVPKNKYKNSLLNQINNSVSNLSFYLVRFQIVVVYLVSGLAKVDGLLWQNGTALYYTLSIDEYSHPVVQKIISNYPAISVIGTYATLVYQLSFPWLVWNRQIRPWLLLFGAFIHIQISFVMGLFMFGLSIATSYFSFTTDNAAKKILNIRATIEGRYKRYLAPVKLS